MQTLLSGKLLENNDLNKLPIYNGPEAISTISGREFLKPLLDCPKPNSAIAAMGLCLSAFEHEPFNERLSINGTNVPGFWGNPSTTIDFLQLLLQFQDSFSAYTDELNIEHIIIDKTFVLEHLKKVLQTEPSQIPTINFEPGVSDKSRENINQMICTLEQSDDQVVDLTATYPLSEIQKMYTEVFDEKGDDYKRSYLILSDNNGKLIDVTDPYQQDIPKEMTPSFLFRGVSAVGTPKFIQEKLIDECGFYLDNESKINFSEHFDNSDRILWGFYLGEIVNFHNKDEYSKKNVHDPVRSTIFYLLKQFRMDLPDFLTYFTFEKSGVARNEQGVSTFNNLINRIVAIAGGYTIQPTIVSHKDPTQDGLLSLFTK